MLPCKDGSGSKGPEVASCNVWRGVRGCRGTWLPRALLLDNYNQTCVPECKPVSCACLVKLLLNIANGSETELFNNATAVYVLINNLCAD